MTERDDILRRVEERAEKILASAPRPKTHWWIIGGGAFALAMTAIFLVFGKSNYSIKDSDNATIISNSKVYYNLNKTDTRNTQINVAPTLEDKGKDPAKCQIKGHISKETRMRFYYLPSDPAYDKMNIDYDRGEQWFCSEKEAVGAGWERAIIPTLIKTF